MLDRIDPPPCDHDDADEYEVHAFGGAHVATYTDCRPCAARPRQFRWLQHVRHLMPRRLLGASPVDASGTWREVRAPATWDHGGRYVVLETVAGGLEYLVVDAASSPPTPVRTVPLSLDDAIGWAREFEQSETVTAAQA